MAEAVRPQQRMKKKVKRKKEKLEDSITKPEASKSSWFVEEDDVKQPEDVIPKEAPSEASEIRLNDPARLSQVATLDSENEKDGSQADDQDNTEIQDLTEVKEHIEPSSEESCFGNIDGSESREENSIVIEQEGDAIEYDAVEEDRENYSLEAKERGEGDVQENHESDSTKLEDVAENTIEQSEANNDTFCEARDNLETTAVSDDCEAPLIAIEDDIENTQANLEQESSETSEGPQQQTTSTEMPESIQAALTSNLADELLQNDVKVIDNASMEAMLFNEDFDQILHENFSSSTKQRVSQQQAVQPILLENYVRPPAVMASEYANVIPVIPVFETVNATLAPFTEEQLRNFYHNPELEQVTMFIDQFLKNTVKEISEFYELVSSYQKCRVVLAAVTEKIKTMKQELKTCQERVWTLKRCQYKSEGICRDNARVQKLFNYEQMEYNEYEAILSNRKSKDVRGLVHEDYQLKCYNSQLAKIRIECYINVLLNSSQMLKDVRTSDPITAVLPRDIHSDDVRSLVTLQDSISVLFSFKRMNDLEELFKKDLEMWLELLVSTLQRAGALPDHFFLLNHLIRCPPSTIAPLAHFIQFPKFQKLNRTENWNSPLVHHFIVMLATLALPVRERLKYMSKYRQTMKPNMNRAMSWTLVDEDREEDENPEDSWSLMLEADLVALFEQFPFEKLLKFLLRMDEAEASYSAANSTSNDVVRLFAFTSCLLKLLGQMFETYNLIRYRQFVKRISRTIRWVVQVVADHWCAYRSWRIEVCGESDKDIPSFMTVSNQYSLERLQLEFDQFFSKATEHILQSHSVGALQFLASMPYDAISTNAAWSLLNRLTNTCSDEHHPQPGIASVIPSMNAPEEAVFLLISLANMATSRTKDDREFIEIAAKNILEIAYVDEATVEICSRNGRDLLATVASKHPFVMSTLLWSIAGLTEKMSEDCVYILKALPFHLWFPMSRDLEKLRFWLLEHQLGSLQHKMAKAVISQMNFDVDQETGQLFLPQNFHFAMAVMLVEVYGSCIPDGPGGLRSLEYDEGGFISQVGKFAVQSINKLIYAQIQDEFTRWCFDILLSLKLHNSDAPSKNTDQENEIFSLDENLSQDDGSWFDRTLSVFQNMDNRNLDIEHSPEMLNVKRAAATQGSLACYVALAMTKLGHSADHFTSKGEKLLLNLLDGGWIDAVLRIVSNIVPLFAKCLHLLSLKHQFMRIIDSLVHLDANRAGYTEKLWQYPEPGIYSQKLASILTNHIIVASKQSDELGSEVISIWFLMLSNLANWYRDLSVQYLLDHICKVTYLIQHKMNVVSNLLVKQFQNLVESQAPRGIISSVISWMSSSAPVTLLEIKKIPDYSYYAYAVIQMEMLLEVKYGLWKELTSLLMTKAKYSPESAYKKVCSSMKSAYLPPFQSLSIFRWAEQGLSTNADHPLLPLIWQQFFKLFLQKQRTEAGMPNRSGVGYKFFENVTRTTMSKKIRSHLNSVSSHHRIKSVPQEGEEPAEFDVKAQIHDQAMHAKLASLYQAMALWMDEPRLHDPNLFLDALPEIYQPALLVKIFQSEEAPWFQFLDTDCIANEVESIETLWTMILNKSTRIKTKKSGSEDVLVKPTASQQVVKRLTRESIPKEPPPVQDTPNPVPEVPLQLLLTRPRLIQDLNEDLERVVLFAKSSCMKWDENTALDEEYHELLADLYEHTLRHFVIREPCDGRTGKRGMCTGPANLVFRFEERCLRERNERCIRDNRAAWESIISSATQEHVHDLCVGAVYVENIISMMMKSLQYASIDQRKRLESAGAELFYLLAELINNDVKRCHPAIQFFSSCTEILGKEFIANNDEEQLRLLKTILSEEASVSFLAPHFNPCVHSRSFLQLYAHIADSNAENKQTTHFVLLTKFDVRGWLNTQPVLSERVFVIRAIMTSLQKFGLEPSVDMEMVFGQYRSHMVFLLCHRFPDLYSEVLKLVAEASREKALAPVCWGDFLLCIGCSIEGHTMPTYAESNMLQIADVNETINWLTTFFADVSQRIYYSTSELYAIWHPYVRYVTKFLSCLFNKLTEPYLSQEFSSDLTKERFINNSWSMIFAAYRPWIVPRKADRTWPSQHAEDAICLIQSFTEAARTLAQCSMVENKFSFGMNMIWTFYCAEVATAIKEEASLEIYHSLLATLSWRYYCPSVQDLERMLELYYENPAAFHFLGAILCDLDWPMIIQRYTSRDDRVACNTLYLSVLRIFIMLAVNKLFMDRSGSRVAELTDVVVACDWDGVSAEDISTVCIWFLENLDPVTIIENEIYERTVLRLLKTACRMLPITNSTHNFSEKRRVYVETIAKLIERASSLKFARERFNGVIPTLLRDIERVINVQSGSRSESISLLNAVLVLLNSISEGPILDGIETQIHVYLAETNCERLLLSCLTAGCRALASLDQLVRLCECAIESFLARQSDADFQTAWARVLEVLIVPDLNQDDFVRKALSKQCLITLYAFNLHRLSLCPGIEEELVIVIDTFRWCLDTPPSPLCTEKMILIWWQILNAVKRQILHGKEKKYMSSLLKYISLFSHYCQQICEDKSYSGLLGAFGIGKKSMFPTEFRFAARSLHAFLSAQLFGSFLRCVPDAPGCIAHSHLRDKTKSPASEAKMALQSFTNLQKSKSYAMMKEEIRWIKEFISDSKTCLVDGPELLAYVCRQLYYKTNFVLATVCKNASKGNSTR